MFGVLFVAPVPPDFRKTPAGRHAISMFRTLLLLVEQASVCATRLSPLKSLGVITAIKSTLMTLVSAVSFYWKYRKISRAAVQLAGFA